MTTEDNEIYSDATDMGVFHVCSNCTVGRRIAKESRVAPAPEAEICTECARLRRLGQCE